MNALHALVTYGLKHHWIHSPTPSLTNLFNLYKLTLESYREIHSDIETTLATLLDSGFNRNLFEPNTVAERDAFEAYLFDFIMPSPTETKMTFLRLYQQNPEKAFSYLYELSVDVNYIKRKRNQLNVS